MLYLDKEIETLPRNQLEKLQLQKLQSMMSGLWCENDFYTRKWEAEDVRPEDIRTLADIPKLPITTKSELVQDQADNGPFGSNLTYSIDKYVRFHQTSGTTGQPLKVMDTEESWDWWGKCWAYVLSGAGLTPHDRVFMAFAFGPFVGFWAAVEGARKLSTILIPGGGRDSMQRLELMRDMGATVLACTPTYALRLAEVARETGFNMGEIPIRSTIHAGEPGANIPTTKKRIEDVWAAKCFDHAGASEVGAHSFECELQPGGTHLIESEFIAEVLDPVTLEPVAVGDKGELVITNLGRWAFPVVRYRTGDMVRANLDQCGCGRTFMRFDGGVIGRVDDMVTVRGVNVFPTAVENIIRQFDEVIEFRITVHTVKFMDEMEIEFELADGTDAVLFNEIGEKLYAMLGFRPIIQAVQRGSLPRFDMKAKRFHVKKDSAG